MIAIMNRITNLPCHLKFSVALCTFGLLGMTAQAHTGHHGMSGGFGSGFAHPLGGWDHLLAMVAVGLWAVQIGGRRPAWGLPITFLSFMLIGLLLGTRLQTIPLLETGILLSVLLLGVFLILAYRPVTWIGITFVAGFALFHGSAHGMEMPTHSSGWLYSSGMLIATGLLHAAGILAAALLAMPGTQWIRLSGAAILVAATGFFFLT